jgi:hypothetical protein
MYLATNPGAASMIGADHRAQILRVEPRRQRRRADEIAEQHRQLPPLGVRLLLSGRWRCRGRRGGRDGSAQRRNRSQEPFAVPHRDAELFEVGLGQLGQDLVVDLVLAEHRLVLFEAQCPQPGGDIHLDLRRGAPAD